MTNASQQGTSFWVRHKSVFDGVIKAAAMIVALKMAKIVVDKVGA